MRRLIFLALLATGCATTANSPVVLGVEIEAAEGRPTRWAGAADEIAKCAARLDDPRLLNGMKVRQYATAEEVGRGCLSFDAAACYVAAKKLALVSPRDDNELPAYCHEVGHHLANERFGEPDHCHLRADVWKAIDGSTCTCRCPPAAPESTP